MGVGLMTMLASCVGAPQPAPAPAPRPAAPPVPVAPPAPARPARLDWRDAPVTPGDWHWAREGADSVARYGSAGGSVFVLRCAAAVRMVTMDLPSPAAPQNTSLTITTSSQTRTVLLQPRGSWLEATLGPRDTMLDAMAFSRGRFMVAVQGGASLYLPSWPEVSRVVEDCRGQ